MIKKVAILLGINTVESCELRVVSSKPTTHNPQPTTLLKRILFAILLAFSIWHLASGVGEGYVIVNNRAALSYTNVNGVNYCDTFSDTVQIWVYSGPTMSITKTTKNLRSGEVGGNTQPVSVVPGDTAEMTLSSHNVGDTYSYVITIVDTFPSDVGDPSIKKLNYVVGSETCAINGSAIADSISWCTDSNHVWNEWQIYNETVSLGIPATCTGIRWRWNIVIHNDEDNLKSWIRVRYQWFRNNNQ